MIASAAKHTPGPWRVEPATSWISTVGDPYGRGRMHVADVRGWGHLTGRGGGCAMLEDTALAIQEANARLIAAAPELLDALVRLLDVCDRMDGEIQEAIALTEDEYEDATAGARAALAKTGAA